MREIRLCNNEWKFIHENRCPKTSYDKQHWSDIGLPHSFGIPYFMENEFYVGYGSYVKEITLTRNDLKKRILLEFLGSFQVTEVYLNGEYIGSHKGGYTPFAFDLTDKCDEGKNEIFVRVNNMWNAQIAPRGGEHQFNGGIYRDVHLILTSRTCVERLGTFVKTEELRDTCQAVLSIETEVVLEREGLEVSLESLILSDEEVIVSEEIKVNGQERQKVLQRVLLKAVRLWTPEEPNQYLLVSRIKVNGVVTDEYRTGFGIRTVLFDKEQGFFLNGVHYDIHGANVHQDHAGWADAVTRSGITRDIRLVKDCGMNFIRGSHYPHHPYFAEECDRIGLLFWPELCFWGTSGPDQDGYWSCSAYPIAGEDEIPFEASCLQTLEEMIRANRNSPSVIVWSVCNEPFFSAEFVMDKARALVKKLVSRVHELDATRVAAVGGAQRGDFDVLGDVAGYNGDGASLFINPGNPSFVSEYGSSVSFRPGNFSPNYTDNVAENFPWRSGKALWCGFHHGSIIGNMGAMGMIDYYRLPLNTWYWYRQELKGIPGPAQKKCGVAAKLKLCSDVTVITANGQKDAHIIVEVLDSEDQPLANELEVTLSVLEGDGIFPTGKSITLSPGSKSFLDGVGAIEFRSYFGGINIIEATAEGVASDCLRLHVEGERRMRSLAPMKAPPYLTPAPAQRVKYNIAINKPVFCSSFKTGYEPANVTSEHESYWIPEEMDPEPWLKIDLEGTRSIEQIEVQFFENGQKEPNWVYLSEDNQTYENLLLKNNRNDTGCTAFGKWDFRYIKILLNKEQKGIQSIRLWMKKP